MTQPFELLNSLGFNKFKNTHFDRKVNEKNFDHESLSNESEEFEKNIDSSMHDVNSEVIYKENSEEFEGLFLLLKDYLSICYVIFPFSSPSFSKYSYTG